MFAWGTAMGWLMLVMPVGGLLSQGICIDYAVSVHSSKVTVDKFGCLNRKYADYAVATRPSGMP